MLVLLTVVLSGAAAQDVRSYVPEGAREFAPVLALEQRKAWPRMPEPWTLGGQVEQESCISLRHSKCWNPRAELKTHREYGFGFGQITIAYRADGSERFNKFQELRAGHEALSKWEWSARYDPEFQLRAIVLMDLELWRRIPPAATVQDHTAFVLASYNGGVGSVLQDRRLCDNTAGCDPTRWFGHVAKHSLKSKVPQKAYGGKSWYAINREYVTNVLLLRRNKYRIFWEP
jgi:hypothetical protein